MTKRATQDKKYAAVGNPIINAVVKSLFRFENQEQAIARLQQLKKDFVVSKRFTKQETPTSAIIWIRGYQITKEQKKDGCLGNYATISCQPAEGGRFTLTAIKLETDLKYHPQRKRPKKSHPDWGHPILRNIKKKKLYSTIEEATKELNKLHLEFPEISIPGDTRLMIMIYEKAAMGDGKKGGSPVQKYKFEVKALPTGGFIIGYKLNSKVKVPSLPPDAETSAQGQQAEKRGYFTAMVELKRRRKMPKPTSNP